MLSFSALVPRISAAVCLRVSLLLICLAGSLETTLAQTAHLAGGARINIGIGLNLPLGVAVDSSGNVFVTDLNNSRVKEILAPDYTTTVSIATLNGNFNQPTAIAIDTAGNLFVTDQANGTIKEIAAAGGYVTVSTIATGFNFPTGVAVDREDNVFVADFINNQLYELPVAGGYSVKIPIPVSFSALTGVAVDANGNLYTADENDGIQEIPVASEYKTLINLASGNQNIVETYGIALDSNGNLYYTDLALGAVFEISLSSGYQTVTPVLSNLNEPEGVTVDANGDVFVADANSNTVDEVPVLNPVVGFGSVPVGTNTPPAQTLTFQFDSPGTVQAPLALTQGVSGQDFTVTGGSCTASSYNTGDKCTVIVSFTPMLPGDRHGAVQLRNSSGAPIVTTYVYGVGSGPHILFSPATSSALGSGFNQPQGVAVDGGGNVFVGDTGNNAVKEIVAAGGYATVSTLGSGFNLPQGVAVDGAGNLYVADTGNDAIKQIIAPFYTTINTLGSGFNSPTAVSVDEAGNVYVNDTGNDVVKEILAAGGYTTVNTVISGADFPSGDEAVDGSGNVFQADTVNNRVEMLDYADAPSLGFAPTQVGHTSSSGSQIITVSNNGNAALTFTGLSYPVDFPEASDANLCTGSTSLGTGSMCNVPVQFTPVNAGTLLSENVTLIDNSLNVAGAVQSIAVSGNSDPVPPTQFSVTTTDTVIAGTPFSVTIAALGAANQAATGYNGTVTLTSGDPGFVNPGPITLANGVGVTTVMLTIAPTQTITATDTVVSTLTGTGSFAVNPGLAMSLGITAPAASNSGASFNVSVTAYDAYSNVASGYPGTVTFTSTDAFANLPADTTLTAGSGVFSAILATPGVQTITVTDTVNSAFTATTTGTTVTAPTLVVNTAIDDTGSDTNCTPQTTPGTNATDTACSLRDALAYDSDFTLAANISFDSTVFSTPQTITLANGTLEIPPNTTITGPISTGSAPTNLVTVDGATVSTVFEAIEELYNGPVLSNLNIANGNGGPDPGGAGGFNVALSALTLTNCNFTGNTGGDAGAIFIEDGLVSITGSTFSSNQSFGGDSAGDGDAGAIYNVGFIAGPALKPNTRFHSLASRWSSNRTAWPSALAAKGLRRAVRSSDIPTGTPGTLTVVNSTFTNNSGYFAGGIFNGDGLLVSGSTFTGNTSSGDGSGDGDGGAIVNYGFGTGGAERPVSPKTAKTQHSRATGRMKQALAHALASPIVSDEYPSGIPSVINSTFSNNSGVYSGGVNNAGGFIWVAFSTFSQNSSSGDGLGDSDAGGFLSTFGGESIIANNTFFGNSSTSQLGAGAMAGVDESHFESYGATASGNSGFFGGLYGDASASPSIFNSIVTGNTTTNTDPSNPSDPNVNGVPFDPTTGDIVGDPNANLAPLGNYGGPTQTMIPLPGSSAICAGNLGTLASVEGDAVVTLTTDQRGLPNTNSTYPGYSSTPCVDAGAVQTNYAIAFTTQPPADAVVGVPVSPAPVVTLTESGSVFGVGTSTVDMTDADSVLSGGTNSAALSSGAATFTNLIFSAIETGDTLTASLNLNPNLSPALVIMSQPSSGVDVGALAMLTSPAPGLKTVLPSTNVTFQWNAGTGVTQFRLDLGTAGPGATDVFTYVGTNTSATVSNIHPTGGTVYARLSSYIYGKWMYNDYVYTASPVPAKAVLTTPTPGLSTLLGSSNVNFQWTAGTGVSLYQLSLSVIGPGQSELFLFKGSGTSATASFLPTMGQIVYARLYSDIGGVWQYNDYQYTESGTPVPAILRSPTPGLGTVLGTNNVTFQWSTGTGVSLYQLNLGSSLGASDLFIYKGTATSITVPSLPANGQIVYARLYSRINGVWVYDDYQYYNDNGYSEGGTPAAAVLQSPTPGQGTVLGTSNVPFQWNAGTGVTDYQLVLGTTGPGASDLFTYKGTALTTTVPALPSNGVVVYARLWSNINGTWQHNDYVYSESGSTVAAVLTSPTPGLTTILGTSNVQFQWSAGTGVALYQLNLSTVAPGKSELFIYKGSATNTVAPALPGNGVTVYARLYSKINGVWQFNDYFYTEQ